MGDAVAMIELRERIQSIQNPLRGSMGRRLAIIILPVVIIPLLLQGSASYIRSRDILEEQATEQLQSALLSESQRLRNWVTTREERLLLGSRRSTLQNTMLSLMNTRLGSQTFEFAQNNIRTALADLQEQDGQELFSNLMVVRATDGVILTSTDEDWEEQTLTPLTEGSLQTSEIITTAMFDVPMIAPNSLAVFTAIPVRIPMANDEALLIGVNTDLNLGILLESMQVFQQRVGVFRVERGETFLVMEPDIIIRIPRYSTEPEASRMMGGPLIEGVMSNPSGTTLYSNMEGEPLLASYTDIEEIGLTLAIELSQADVFEQVNTLGTFSLIVAAAAAVIVVILITVVTNRLLSPLSDLTEFAERISRGDWQYRVPEDRDDEIGILASAFNRMADDLRGVYQSLEDRVQERTQQIQIASQVARAVTATPSLDDLLFKAVNLIRDQFGFYYVSIFLLDEPNEYAELVEATGEVGKALIARSHRLRVGGQSMIGWVTQNNQPRVASEVSQDPVHFRNEFLPETRAELAVPLQLGGRVLGALDVQSDQPESFKPQDVEVMQTLADQLSAAIQNARLAETSVAAAERSRAISQATREMSGIMDVEQVLDKAASVLHEALGKPEIQVELVQPQEYDEQATRPVDLSST